MPASIARREIEAIKFRYSPSRTIQIRGLKDGLFGGNRGWLALYLAFVAIGTVRRAFGHQQERIAIDVLKPGERVTVRAIPVRNGKERKRLLRGG